MDHRIAKHQLGAPLFICVNYGVLLHDPLPSCSTSEFSVSLEAHSALEFMTQVHLAEGVRGDTGLLSRTLGLPA